MAFESHFRTTNILTVPSCVATDVFRLTGAPATVDIDILVERGWLLAATATVNLVQVDSVFATCFYDCANAGAILMTETVVVPFGERSVGARFRWTIPSFNPERNLYMICIRVAAGVDVEGIITVDRAEPAIEREGGGLGDIISLPGKVLNRLRRNIVPALVVTGTVLLVAAVIVPRAIQASARR